MFSVFFHMSEFMTNVIFGILERVMLGEKPAFVEEFRLTFAKDDYGWVLSAVGDSAFAEYRGKNILFKPRIPVLHRTETVSEMPFIKEGATHERVFVHWRDVASENFFRDVETLFKRVQQQQKVPRGGS